MYNISTYKSNNSDLFVNFFTVIEEGGVKMKLTVVDTPGFGDQINNDNWWVFPTPGSLKPHKYHHHCFVLPEAVFLVTLQNYIFRWGVL